MENIFIAMKEAMIDHMLEKRFKGDSSVDETLSKLSSPDETVWMQELFSGYEEEIIHGYDIQAFAYTYFALKNIRISPNREKIAVNERLHFLKLSLEKQIQYIEENITCKITERGESQTILKQLLEKSLSNEVRSFIHEILDNPDLLSKVQLVSDDSYFLDVILIRPYELIPTSYQRELGTIYIGTQEIIRKICQAKVVSLNISQITNGQLSR